MQSSLDPTLLDLIRPFGTSLAIGLLIGVERERKGDSRGLRTFALVCLLGALVPQLARASGRPELHAIGLALIGLIAVAAYWHDALAAQPGAAQEIGPAQEKPTTSVVAMIITGGLGMLCGLGEDRLAVALAIVVASLLVFKGELRGMAGRIRRDDLIPVLQLGALSFIVLPLLPDRAWGPAGSLNPHHIWLMVVLVSAVGLCGYLALRFSGARMGVVLAALAGGLVSSTATTLVFARHAKATGRPALPALGVLLANLTMLVRLMVMIALVEPRLMAPVATILGAGLLAGSVALLWLQRTVADDGQTPLPNVQNPTQLREALAFGLAFGAISWVAALATTHLGAQALYGVAALSGLTDVDAISLSSLGLFGAGYIQTHEAVWAIGIAVCANMLIKAGIVFVSGGAAAGRTCAAVFAVIIAAIVTTAVFTLGSISPSPPSTSHESHRASAWA